MTTSKNKKLSGQAGDGRTARKDARKTEETIADHGLEGVAAGSAGGLLEKVDVNAPGLPKPHTLAGKLL